MKIRNGFVSNSSSSSFVILGVKLTPESLLKNESYKFQFDKEMKKEQLKLDVQWEKKLNHQDYEKHKGIYEMCKANGVSMPKETKDFFGYNFSKGVLEPAKANEKDILNEMVWGEKFKFPDGISLLSDDGPSYLGKIIADGDELNNGSISLTKLKTYTEELIKIGFEETDIKIYYGTRAC